MEKKEDIEQQPPAETHVATEEEEKKGPPMTEETKKSSIRDNLMQLVNQMEGRGGYNAADRRQLDMIKQLIPLYEKHDFWDTQPVPSSSIVRLGFVFIDFIGERAG